MKWFSARSRITLGLTCLLVSVLCTAMLVGVVPDRNAAVLQGRADLCEAIAMCGSDYVSRKELRRLEHLLKLVVKRNEGLLSAGVRRQQGDLIIEVGDHAASWSHSEGELSTDTHVHVPLRAGDRKWGAIELRFRTLNETSWLGYWKNSWVRMTLFVAAGSCLLFFVYLGKMLQHLDPSKAVPKRVRAALDSLAEGLLVIDREGRIVLANQALAAWVHKLPEKLVGMQASQLDWVKNEQGDTLETYPWVEAIKQEAAQAGVMLALRHKSGQTQILIANASPVLGHDGKYRGVLVSFDDVTQLEDTRRDLKVAKLAAEDANRAKSEFLAHMSHEIRTPMNAILGYTDVLRRGFDETLGDRQEYLNTIHASGEHLLALINDILDLSKIEAGRMELELQRCSPHELILQVVSLLRSKAEEKGISLDFECHGTLPETILADEVRLRQAIVNLAANAIKFTDRGGVRIVARMERCGSRGKPAAQLAIDVIDTGIGISQDAQQRIFNPFSQADASITHRFGGTGLGLAISSKLARAMGGNLTVASEPGQGSTFTVTLDPGPLEGVPHVDANTALARLAQRPIQAQATLQLPPARVLVADDGDSNRKLVQLVLRRAGLTVVAVENGQQAVDCAMRESFEIILMDMQMPVMDGFTATRRLRQAGYELPIIALTANAMQGDEEACRAAGCSGFLTKPVNIDRLLAALAEVLGGPVDPFGEPRQTPSRCREPSGTCGEASGTCGAPSPARLAGPTEPPLRSSLPTEDADFREIVEDFIRRLEEQLAAMELAWSVRDFDGLAALAHWLKGCGGSAGFDAFTLPAKALEYMAKHKNTELIPAAIDDLRTLANRIVEPDSFIKDAEELEDQPPYAQ